MKNVYFFCLIVALGFTACDDDDYEILTRSEYLAENGCWYLEDAHVTANVDGREFSGKVSQYLPDCIEDNSFTFHPGGALTINDRHIKCDKDDPQQFDVPVKWELIDRETRLRASIPGLAENIIFEVVQLDGKYLRLKWYDTYLNTPSTFEVRFSHRH